MASTMVIYAAVPVTVIVALGLIRKLRSRRWGKCLSKTSLRGKTYIVTGATSGVGLETARALVRRHARVIFAVRDVEKAKQIIDDIRRKQPKGGEMIPMHLDLTSLDSIESFAELVKAAFYKIDVLINNAGVAVPLDLDFKTEDGFEINMGVNHLGHFHLTNLLLDLLVKASPSRVVVVTSTLAEKGVINFDDINLRSEIEAAKVRGRSRNNPGYNNSKLMNVYFARALSDRCRERGVDVHACCPGWTYTNLFRHSLRWYHYILMAPICLLFMRTAKQGAQTVLYCATDYSVEVKTGKVYRDCAEYSLKHTFEQDKEKQLWRLSEEMVAARKPL